jgi:hypothetical protein
VQPRASRLATAQESVALKGPGPFSAMWSSGNLWRDSGSLRKARIN